MAAKSRGHRYTIEDRGDTLRVLMPTPSFGVIFLAGLIVLFGGPLCYIFLILGLMVQPVGLPVYGAGIGLFAFLLVLVIFACRKLVVQVSSQSIAVWDDILGVRLGSKRYLARHIRELRISAASPGLVAFDYGAATVTFRRNLGAAGAAEIVAEIKRRFPQYQQEHGDASAQPEQPFIKPPSAIGGPSEGIGPPPLRYRSEVSGNMLRITIPSPKKWPKHIIGLALLCLLSFIVMLEIAGGVRVLIQILCAIWWALGVIWIISNFLWELVGREEIELTPDSITIRETTLGIGRPRVYARGDTSRMRVDPAGRVGTYAPNDEGSMTLSKGTGMIAFDYHGKHTDRMGICLTEAEAKELVAEIQRQFPQYK